MRIDYKYILIEKNRSYDESENNYFIIDADRSINIDFRVVG